MKTRQLGGLTVSGQSLWVIGASVVLIVALYVFFERSLYGKALRATGQKAQAVAVREQATIANSDNKALLA